MTGPRATNANAWDDRALITAMALVPSFFSRNKMPALYADPRVMRARGRARLLRSIARDLRSGHDRVVTHLAIEPKQVHAGEGVSLRYALPNLFLQRSVDLASFEVVILRRLLLGAGPAALAVEPNDATTIASWLHGLMTL